MILLHHKELPEKIEVLIYLKTLQLIKDFVGGKVRAFFLPTIRDICTPWATDP